MTFRDAAAGLSRFGITGELIYLIDLVLLAEIAWADGRIQDAEENILYDYIRKHVDCINRLACCQVINYETAKEFVEKLLKQKPDQAFLEKVKELIPTIRFNTSSTPEELNKIKYDILDSCLDIASSAVTRYPYGLRERFTDEEKKCYHKIVAIFTGIEENNPQKGEL